MQVSNVQKCLSGYVRFLQATTLFQTPPDQRTQFLSTLRNGDLNPHCLKLVTPETNSFKEAEDSIDAIGNALGRRTVLTQPEIVAPEIVNGLQQQGVTRLLACGISRMVQPTPYNHRFFELQRLNTEILELLTIKSPNGVRVINEKDLEDAIAMLPSDQAKKLLRGFLNSALRSHNSLLFKDGKFCGERKAVKKEKVFLLNGLSNLPHWVRLVTSLDPETLSTSS